MSSSVGSVVKVTAGEGVGDSDCCTGDEGREATASWNLLGADKNILDSRTVGPSAELSKLTLGLVGVELKGQT